MVAANHGVAVALVKGERRRVETTGCVLYTQQIKVALHNAVLAGVAVNDNESQVETHFLAAVGHRKVSAVHGAMLTVVGKPIPLVAVYAIAILMTYNYLIDIVFPLVKRVIHLTTAVDGDLVLAREASHH